MLYDTLENFQQYISLSPHFRSVIEFVNATDLVTLPTGRHDIGSLGVYASVNEYQTKPQSDCFIESHLKYIDVQIVASGIEVVGVCAKSNCRTGLYDESKDFMQLYGSVDFITLSPGLFAVFFPQDGHMPGVSHGAEADKVKKIVIKVPFTKEIES
jgi:YhcH/YjgK/YiaL family protein